MVILLEAAWWDQGLDPGSRRQKKRGRAVLTPQNTDRKEQLVAVVATTVVPAAPMRMVTLL